MLSTDRAEFEAELAVLFGAFPTFLTPPRIEAYWRGLQKMQMSMFKRCIGHVLGEDGSEKLPTVNALWLVSKRLRAPAPIPQKQALANVGDEFLLLGNRWLLAFLLGKGGASDESLVALIAMKDRIVGQFRSSGDTCGGESTAEWLDVANGAFEKLWRDAPGAQIEAAMQRHSRGIA